jgi:hypothetical protein
MPGNRALALFVLAALLLAVPVALAQVPPATPEAPVVEPLAQPAEQAEQQAEGDVKAVENNTLTISTAEGEELVLNVTDSARITKDGMEELGIGSSGLKQLAVGDHVSVTYNKDTMEAQNIDALSGEQAESDDATQQPEEPVENETQAPAGEMSVLPQEDVSIPAGEAVEGRVTGVNKENNILVVQTLDGKYLAFRLADGTSIRSEEGQDAGIEALSRGTNVSVRYDEQTKNALEVVVLPALEENVSAVVPPAQEENAAATA